MLVYFFALLLAAVVVLLNDFRSETNRWAAIFLFCAAIGGVTDALHRAHFETWSRAAQFVNLVVTPYGVLIFCLVYAGISRPKLHLCKRLLLLPVGVMLAAAGFSADFSIHDRFLLVWTAPYFLVSCYVLIAAWVIERDGLKKKKRFVTAIIVVPTLLAVLAFIYGARAIRPDFDYFNTISVFIGYSLIAGLLGSFLHGVLGVKLRFERDPLEGAMKAADSGSVLLNHTIKNELGKIAISSENLKASITTNDEASRQHLDIISNASEHMLTMVSRIHEKTRTIVLREEPCRLDQLCEECRVLQQPLLLHAPNITLAANYAVRPTVFCDHVHMKEAINNLLRNAIEAMPASGGTVEISLNAFKKGIVLTVEDNGEGMPANRLAHVFDPFFSTKEKARNFGLGLSYVYKVMQKSEGFVRIRSRERIGTAVELHYPRRKIIRADRGDPNGPH